MEAWADVAVCVAVVATVIAFLLDVIVDRFW